MAEQKRVSGMTVGPQISEDQHDAILETRERRREVARTNAEKAAGKSGTSQQDRPEPPQQSKQSQTKGQ